MLFIIMNHVLKKEVKISCYMKNLMVFFHINNEIKTINV